MPEINFSPEVEKAIADLKQALASQIEQEVSVKVLEKTSDLETPSNSLMDASEQVAVPDLSQENFDLGQDKIINQEIENPVPVSLEDTNGTIKQNVDADISLPDLNMNSTDFSNNELETDNTGQFSPSTENQTETLHPPASDLLDNTSTKFQDSNNEESSVLPDMPLPSGFDAQPSPFTPSNTIMGEINQLSHDDVAPVFEKDGNLSLNEIQEAPNSASSTLNSSEGPILEPSTPVTLDDLQATNDVSVSADQLEPTLSTDAAVAQSELDPTPTPPSFNPSEVEIPIENQVQASESFDETQSVDVAPSASPTNHGFSRARGLLQKVMKRNN